MSSFNKHDSDSDEEVVPAAAAEVDAAPPAEPEEDTSLANSDVVTKYLEAAKIANMVLQEVMAQCVVGARVIDICVAGDASIEAKCGAIFRNKVKGVAMQKGVAFPVCVSVNECVCNMSPLISDDATAKGMVLANDDTVKIDLGVHIDGYIAVVAHTLIVGTPATSPIDGARASTFHAAWAAARVTARTLVAGKTSADVVAACNKALSAYPGVCSLEGVTMHQMKRYVIDGNKIVNIRPADPAAKVEVFTFEQGEVYACDICITSGDGKAREGDGRTTVYKRKVDKTYQLKMKAARVLFNEVNKKFPTMPFSMRSLDDERGSKLGIRECVNHDLLQPFPVVYERPGDHVVHVRFTLLLLPHGTVKITGLELVPEGSSAFCPPADMAAVDAELAALMVSPEPEKKKKDRKRAGKGASSSA